jgi:serine protease Do
MAETPRSAGSKSGASLGVAALLVLVLTLAFAGAWLAGSALSTRGGGDVLAQLSPPVSKAPPPTPLGFEDIVARVKPAVFGVRAKVVDGSDSDEDTFLLGLGEQPSPPQHQEASRPTTSLGSGFFITSDGYAITSNHVIEHGTSIEIEADDGKTYPANLVGSDPQTDIALLKIDGGNDFKFVEISDQAPRIGEWVIAVGNPFGLGGTVTAGIVSARARDISAGSYSDFIQIDAPVNQGNSGGPTFDVTGKVIGVNSAIVSPTGGSVGIGFAIPAETVKTVAAELKDKGTVIRGWIGVHIQPITPEIADGLDLKQTTGALVTDSVPHTPAAGAGILAGDVIASLNGERLKDDRELMRKVSEIAPGTEVELGIIRQGKTKVLDLTTAQLPSPKSEPPASDEGVNAPKGNTDPAKLGLTLVPGKSLGPNAPQGVIVTEVDPDGIAAERGLQPGDVILDVSGNSVSQPSEVKKAMSDAHGKSRRNVIARVKTGDATRFVAIPVG